MDLVLPGWFRRCSGCRMVHQFEFKPFTRVPSFRFQADSSRITSASSGWSRPPSARIRTGPPVASMTIQHCRHVRFVRTHTTGQGSRLSQRRFTNIAAPSLGVAASRCHARVTGQLANSGVGKGHLLLMLQSPTILGTQDLVDP